MIKSGPSAEEACSTIVAATEPKAGSTPPPRRPFASAEADDDERDKFREECGVFGVFGVEQAAALVARGLHALQHRGQEAAGMVTVEPETRRIHQERHHGLVRDNFTREDRLKRLHGPHALGHTRYSTAGLRDDLDVRDIQPIVAGLSDHSVAIAHNGNLTNAEALRSELVGKGAIFQSSSDTECIVHLMAHSNQRDAAARLQDALRRLEGAFSVAMLTPDALIGVRDRFGIRPLVIGTLGDAMILASETVALDVVGAEFLREVEPGEMVTISAEGLHTEFPFSKPEPSRFCVFEYVYFSRPDSVHGGVSVYEARRRIGEELAREAPADADIVCPVPDSGMAAAIGYARAAGLPLELGIIKNQYSGRTFIEPTIEGRNLGMRLKHNANRSVLEGKRVVLVDDSLVRGSTSRKIKELVQEAGAAEVHFRIASPPTRFSCFYGVDTPNRESLMAVRYGEEDAMRRELGVTSLAFVSLDGLYRACGHPMGRNAKSPQFCDACFSGDYPAELIDENARKRAP